MYQPPAGLRGRRPSHRNNAKHGLSALPHPFRATAPNQIKLSKSQIEKFYSIFFKKSQGSRGQRPRSPAAAGEIPAPRTARNSRWPQPAKHPPAATGEIPAPRTARNTRWPQPAKHPPAAAGEIPAPLPATPMYYSPRITGTRSATVSAMATAPASTSSSRLPYP